MSHNVRSHLHLGDEAYDEAIRRFIPGYDALLRMGVSRVASACPRSVTDIGAGTGAFSEMLLGSPRIGTVELLDIDPEMMECARRRLARFGDRARFTLGSFDDPLPARDAFTASFSLHHIPTIERKGALFARVFDALRPGGVFVNVDVTMPSDAEQRDRLYRYWADHMVACGIARERAHRYFDEWSREDTYLPLDEELDALTDAGFDAGCVGADGPVGVVVATRPR